MSISKLWFLSRKSLKKNIIVSIINIILFTAVCVMITVSSGMLDFFKSYSKAAENYNVNLRATMVYTNNNYNENKVLKLFSELDYVDIAANQNLYKTVVDMIDDNGNYGFTLKVSNSRTMPKIIKGRALDYDKSNEIILPEKMLVYNNRTQEYNTIRTSSLIGTQIRFTKDNIDYRTVYDEAENKVIYGGKSIGTTLINYDVVGVYDNTEIFEETNMGLISEKSAKTLHSSDIRNTSPNASETIWIISDTQENSAKVRRYASELGLEYMKVSNVSHRLSMLIIIGYIAIVFVFIIAFIITNLSSKIDIKKNISNYTAFRVCGFSVGYICAFISLKSTILQLISIAICMPVSIVILRKINEYFYAHEIMGGLIIQLTFKAVLMCCLLSAVEILITVAGFYLSESEIKNVFISQEHKN